MDSQKSFAIRYKLWIESPDGESLMGEGKWQLLKAINETGSLKAAVEHMGYTYRQTWQNLKNLEKKLGFRLIEKKRGGIDGGKTVLTEKGRRMVQFFDHLYHETNPVINQAFEKMLDELNAL